MKNRIKMVVLGLMLGGALAFNGAAVQAGGGGCCKATCEKKVKKMAKKFNLTQEQQDQIVKLKMEKKEKMMELGKSYQDQIRNVLNDDQKKMWDAKMEKMNKKMKCCKM